MLPNDFIHVTVVCVPEVISLDCSRMVELLCGALLPRISSRLCVQ